MKDNDGNNNTDHGNNEAQIGLNRISGLIVDAAIQVHIRLGPGLFENVYKQCLLIELTKRKLQVESEVLLPIIYDDKLIDMGYRLDLLVERKIIIELKSVAAILPVHKAQLLAYLKLSGKKVGLLLNFNVGTLPEGIVRLVN